MRSPLRTLSSALAASAVAAAPAWASTVTVPGPTQGAAGGGTGGFGGGGGGGGGGFGGGGGGGGFGGGGGCCVAVGPISPQATFIIFLLIVGFFATIMILGWFATRAQRRLATWSRHHAEWRDDETKSKRKRRAKEVPPAARQASEDDRYFDAGEVRSAADTLFRKIQSAWHNRDQATLSTLVGPDLMIEWGRRLDDFDRKGWHNRIEVKKLDVEYVGLVNRAEDEDDRMVVRVAALLDDYVVDRYDNVIPHSGNPSTEAHLREYWTLGIRNGNWMLLSIEQDIEGEHNLTDPLIALPEEDVGRLRDETMVEQAVENRAPSGTKLGELVDVDFADDALNAARDLSLVDGRLNPDVIEIAVRRTISAWAEAVDGDDEALLDITTPSIAEDLLRPNGPKTRLVIRGPRMSRATVSKLQAKDPIRVAIDAKVSGVRYIEDRDTVDVVAGDKTREVTFMQRFILQLTEDEDQPWMLVAAGEMPRD